MLPGGVEALHARQLLRRPHALVGQVRRVLLLVDLEVGALAQLPGDAVGPGVAGHVVVRRAGNDQRRPRLVDEDVVHLVDDGEVQRPLHLLQRPSDSGRRPGPPAACCRGGSRSRTRCSCRR